MYNYNNELTIYLLDLCLKKVNMFKSTLKPDLYKTNNIVSIGLLWPSYEYHSLTCPAAPLSVIESPTPCFNVELKLKIRTFTVIILVRNNITNKFLKKKKSRNIYFSTTERVIIIFERFWFIIIKRLYTYVCSKSVEREGFSEKLVLNAPDGFTFYLFIFA